MATPIAARGATVGGFVNSVTFSAVPTGSGADRVALVALGATNVNDTPVSVVAGGTDNLAAQGSLLTDGNGWQFRLFAVELTVEGNQDFVCTWDDGFNFKLAALVILPSSTLPIGDLTTGNALTSSTQPTWTIDSATGDTVVALFFLDSEAEFTPTSPATVLTGTGLGGSNRVHGMYRDGASPSAVVAGTVGGPTNLWRGFGFNVPASGGADTTPPTLTSPTSTGVTSSGATVGATTSGDANGTAYLTTTLTNVQPTIAQIKAGQNASGTSVPAGRARTLAISATGPFTFTALASLTPSVQYYYWIVHTDAAGNDSNVVSGNFTTPAVNSPPTFNGPNIANQTAKRGQDLGTLNVAGLFSDTDTLTFSAVGTWPAGVSISSSGVITRAPTAVPGVYSGLQVRATDTASGTADSNSFSFTVQQCALALDAEAYAFGDGNSPATMARLASTSLQLAVYPVAQWPPATPTASTTATTGSNGRLANFGNDNLSFGATYRCVARNSADDETWVWTMTAT